jgi:hypothetical protein
MPIMHNSYMKYLTALLALLLLPPSVHAARWYDVEVIIFADTSDSGLQEEQWALDPGMPDVSNSVSRNENAERLPGQMMEYETLPFNLLAGSLRKLQRSSRYRVIYARAWRLPDLPSHRAPAVRIRAGKRYTPDGGIAPFTPTISNTVDNTETIDDSLYEIDGRIKVSVSKFLDVDADLIYRRYVTLPDATGTPVNELRQFRLDEFRRMRSNTIDYLDHPMFGVVIGISKHQARQQQQQQQQEYDMPQPKSVTEINQ